jgi:hypothetical protein
MPHQDEIEPAVAAGLLDRINITRCFDDTAQGVITLIAGAHPTKRFFGERAALRAMRY